MGLSVREAVTLASLVEKETAAPEERPLVRRCTTTGCGSGSGCSATHGHLRAGAPRSLQREPHTGRPGHRLALQHVPLSGPASRAIAAPGRLSLEAAVRPAPVDYVYFVSRNDGSHAFASSLVEHNRNVQKYQVEFFRKKGGRRQKTEDRRRASSRPSPPPSPFPEPRAPSPESRVLPLRPPQLLPEHLVVASGKGAHEARGPGGLLDADGIGEVEPFAGLAIERDKRFRAVAARVGCTRTSADAGMTSGRFVSVCGAIGFSTSACTAGCTIGPPAERL